ncbi:uncharacterized protein LOC131675503 [Phymastichus coffea]|uniref:uncharacterized protein LOC131675503 n=1 Tax=Phymastichus coffea TaxID=108790 RepID=UPI00273C6E55|nr:uncharacterized protein LOC131675503 [Phymastichus coffea]
MPLNSLGENIDYTSDLDIKYMLEEEEDDYSIEFVGYLCEIPGYKTVIDKNNQEKELFRAVISNGNKRMMLITWDPEKIEELAPKFISGAILHLDGCQGHHITLRESHKDLQLLPYEILIHPTSVVQTKGFRVKATASKKAEIPTIMFKDIENATGYIKVKAYIKTVITQAHTRSGSMDFGSGSLTDGSRKISIHVSNFKAGDSLKMVKGSCVLVTAEENLG